MRILLSSRVDAKQRPGGDSIHMWTLADELRRRGHHVFDSAEELEQAPDILFHFNLGRKAFSFLLLRALEVYPQHHDERKK